MVSLKGSALAAVCDYNGTDHGYHNFKQVNEWCEDFVMANGDPIVCEKDRMIGHKMFPEGSVVLQLPVAIAKNHSSWIAHCLESNGLPYSFSHMGGLGDLGSVVYKRQQGKKLIDSDVTHFLFRRVKIHAPEVKDGLIIGGELRLSDILDAYEGMAFRQELHRSKKRKADPEPSDATVPAASPAKPQTKAPKTASAAKPQTQEAKPQMAKAASPAKPQTQAAKPQASPAKHKPQAPKLKPQAPKSRPQVLKSPEPDPEPEPEAEPAESWPVIKQEPAEVKMEPGVKMEIPPEESDDDWICDTSNFDVIMI